MPLASIWSSFLNTCLTGKIFQHISYYRVSNRCHIAVIICVRKSRVSSKPVKIDNSKDIPHILVYLNKLLLSWFTGFLSNFFFVRFFFCTAHQPNEHLEEAKTVYYVLCILATAFIVHVIMIVTTNNFSTPQLCLNPHFKMCSLFVLQKIIMYLFISFVVVMVMVSTFYFVLKQVLFVNLNICLGYYTTLACKTSRLDWPQNARNTNLDDLYCQHFPLEDALETPQTAFFSSPYLKPPSLDSKILSWSFIHLFSLHSLLLSVSLLN